jgi:hypothetical protein
LTFNDPGLVPALDGMVDLTARGEQSRDYETVVRLIAGTTMAKGLKVTRRLDCRKCPIGRNIADGEFAHVNLKLDQFSGDWDFTIQPNNKGQL